jgi:hypothetical protein
MEDLRVRLSMFAVALFAVLVAGCSEKRGPAVAAAGEPVFDPMAFFDGDTQSWGVIESRSGAPTEQVVTNSVGKRDGANRLRMVQQLSFQDGSSQQREWILWRSGPGHFEATANDMIGTANGEVNGRIFHWQWVLARSPGNPLMNVTMQQWMYCMEDGSATIRTTVSKFGFIVAEVTEHFTHKAAQVSPS